MKKSGKIALCGLMAALSVVIMFLTGLLPSMTIALPGLAGCCLIPVVAELGISWGFATYAVCGVLSFFLSPDREAALIYILLLGYYPVLFGLLAKIKHKPVRIAVKLLLVNAAAALEILLSLWLFHIPIEGGWVLAVVYWVLMNFTFLLYDLGLQRIIPLYYVRLRPRLRQIFKAH